MSVIKKIVKISVIILSIFLTIFVGYLIVIKLNDGSLENYSNLLNGSGEVSIVNTFTALQAPTFTFSGIAYAKDIENNIAVYNSKGQPLEVQMAAKQDAAGGTAVKIINSPQFTPGEYKIEISNNGRKIEQDFAWGVLAINPDKSTYRPGENAFLSLAVLDDKGKMVCDALIRLEIKAPDGQAKALSTKDGTIKVNPECKLKSYTENPDYEANFKTTIAGNYEMNLTAITKNGTYTIKDFFTAANDSPFDVQRESATRIFPYSIYPVKIKVTANQDFTGQIKESVPSSFKILKLDKYNNYDSIQEAGEANYIIWNVSLKKGQTINLGYKYNAPIISPQFYLIGALSFYPSLSVEGFRENRFWQIAADDITYSSMVKATSGLKAYWRFGEPSGTNANEDVGTADGTYVGSPTLGTAGGVAGDSNTAVTYNGTSQYVTVPDSSQVDLGNNFSIELWFKRGDATSLQRLVSKTGGVAYDVSFGGTNVLALKDSSTGNFIVTTGVAITDTNWHHAVFTKAGSVHHAYLDGVLNETDYVDYTLVDTLGTLYMGVAGDITRYFKGTLDDVAFYDTILTPTQVLQHYNAGARIYTPYERKVLGTSGLVSYWRLGEASGNAVDSIAGGNSGSYTGGYTQNVTGAINFDTDTAVSFTGASSGLLTVTDENRLDFGDNFSIEFWYKRNSINSTMVVFQKGTTTTSPLIWFSSGNHINFSEATGSTVVAQLISGDLTATTDTTSWHHVVVTKNGSITHMYIDGVDRTSLGTNVTFANNASNMTLAGVGNYFDGRLDEVAIYNDALTPVQVMDHFKTGNPYAGNVLTTSGLIAYWRLGETGSTANDSKGTANGTYVNTPTQNVTGLIAGDINGAVSLASASLESVDVSSNMPAGSATGATFETWVNLTTDAAIDVQQTLMSWGPAVEAGFHLARFTRNDTNVWTIHWMFSDGATHTNNYIEYQGSNPLPAGTNHHLVIAHDYAAKAFYVYIDGVLRGTGDLSAFGTPVPVPAGLSVRLGGYTGNTSTMTNGTLDEAAIYNVVLTPAQVKQHFYLGASERQSVGIENMKLQGVRIN